MATDCIGRPVALLLTCGNQADITAAPALLDRAGQARRVIADKAYDADSLRRRLRNQGIRPVIPGRRNRRKPIRLDKTFYRQRWRIEAAFCQLKMFRRVATRYDRLSRNFLSTLAIAAIVKFWT